MKSVVDLCSKEENKKIFYITQYLQMCKINCPCPFFFLPSLCFTPLFFICSSLASFSIFRSFSLRLTILRSLFFFFCHLSPPSSIDPFLFSLSLQIFFSLLLVSSKKCRHNNINCNSYTDVVNIMKSLIKIIS